MVMMTIMVTENGGRDGETFIDDQGENDDDNGDGNGDGDGGDYSLDDDIDIDNDFDNGWYYIYVKDAFV